MKTNIPKKLLASKYRREMWKNAKKMIEVLERVIPISSAFVLGSFTTKKRRPADVDFIILLKTKENDDKSKWSVDLALAPDNKYGKFILEDAEKWMKQKYGSKGSILIKLK